jgi:hypothetical protein
VSSVISRWVGGRHAEVRKLLHLAAQDCCYLSPARSSRIGRKDRAELQRVG